MRCAWGPACLAMTECHGCPALLLVGAGSVPNIINTISKLEAFPWNDPAVAQTSQQERQQQQQQAAAAAGGGDAAAAAAAGGSS